MFCEDEFWELGVVVFIFLEVIVIYGIWRLIGVVMILFCLEIGEFELCKVVIIW